MRSITSTGGPQRIVRWNRTGATRSAVTRLLEVEGADVFAKPDAAGLYEEAGMLAEAIEEHTEIVNAPDQDPHRRALSLLAIARLADRLGRFAQAREALRRAKGQVGAGQTRQQNLVKIQIGGGPPGTHISHVAPIFRTAR